jgi:polynucleotide 5'-kinase involved in rRNA processing
MLKFVSPIFTLAIAGLLGRGVYVGHRKNKMVKNSYKKFSTLQRVLEPEERELIITRKREETQIEEACSIFAPVLVFGPRKVGKSTLLKKMTENQLKREAM